MVLKIREHKNLWSPMISYGERLSHSIVSFSLFCCCHHCSPKKIRPKFLIKWLPVGEILRYCRPEPCFEGHLKWSGNFTKKLPLDVLPMAQNIIITLQSDTHFDFCQILFLERHILQ